MNSFTHIAEFATNDPVAAAIFAAIVAGAFAIGNTAITCGTTLLVAYLQHRWHKEHEKVTTDNNAILKAKLMNGTYIEDEISGGKVWPKGKLK